GCTLTYSPDREARTRRSTLQANFDRIPCFSCASGGICHYSEDFAVFLSTREAVCQATYTAQRLTMLLRRKLRQVKARNNEQQLWKSQDCEQGSPKLYYPLKRFAKYPHLLPNYLLPRISRRFNHFFMVYAVDALRESVQIKEKCGEIQFCLNRSALYKQSLAVNQRISQLYSSQDVEVQKTFSAEEPTCTSSSKQSPDRCMVSLAENASSSVLSPSIYDFDSIHFGSPFRCRVMPSFHKLVVNEGFRDSRIPAAPKELPSATPADEDWELKFYERVKQDPAVPSYFKTTFGEKLAKPAVSLSKKASSKKKKKTARKSKGAPHEREEPLVEKPKPTRKALKLDITPKEHLGSPFHDSRVYIPSVNEFIVDTGKESMLDKVSLLPLEELTSLMCGSNIYSLIKNTTLGTNLTKFCAVLQEKHAVLNLREVANDDSITRRTIRLLSHEGSSEEFLTPSAISGYMELMLRLVTKKSSKFFSMVFFCDRLSQRLVLNRPGAPFIDSTLYNSIYRPGHLTDRNVADIQEQTTLTENEVIQLLECLLANILKFFVLYCVHGLRDQVRVKLSNSGEVMYQMKYPLSVDILTSAIESENEVDYPFTLEISQVSGKCIPLDDDYIPLLKDLGKDHSDDSCSLYYQVAHLSSSEIARLILGEALINSILYECPAFLVHMEEYAALLKKSQSALEQREPRIKKKKEGEILQWADVDSYIFLIFASIQDWSLPAKRYYLRTFLTNRLHQLKPEDSDQQLWSPQDYDHGPATLYCQAFYPLMRFAKRPYLLPKELLNRISRRLDHFFLIYAVHTLREGTQITKKCGILHFCPSCCSAEKESEEMPDTKFLSGTPVVESD
ncbi:hypothetical protein GCK32_007624, partial [Trichostrongylus colubriformis]